MSFIQSSPTLPGTPLHQEIANAVRTAREGKGYSLDDLAVASGLVVDEISNIESGIDADPSRLRRIAAALGLADDTLAVA